MNNNCPTQFTIYKGGKIYRDWQNSSYTFIFVDDFEAENSNWLYPVALFANPSWDGFLGKDKIAIRTDAYPLNWVWIMFWIYFAVIIDFYFGKTMKFCNRIGIARTPLGCIPSFKDFFWWFSEK